MAGKYVEPSISAQSFNCPHCGAHASQTWFDIYCDSIAKQGVPWRATHEELETAERELAHGEVRDDLIERHVTYIEYLQRLLRGDVFLDENTKQHYGLPQLANFSVSLCYVCHRPAVWLRSGLIYPPSRSGAEPNEDMPPDVLADYNEARSIVTLSPRGAAALLRLGVQKLCDHLGEKGEKLDVAIANLVQKGLDPRVQKALVDAMYGRLPESKRKAIEERDKRGS